MHDTPLRLAPGVAVVRRQSTLMLHAPRSGQMLRLSPAALPLLQGLQQGTSLEALTQELQARHPQAAQVAQKVEAFLAPLQQRGMLQGWGDESPAPPRKPWPPRLALVQPDPWVAPLARALLVLPAVWRRTLLAALPLASLGALAWLAASGRWPGLQETLLAFDARGLVVFGLVVLVHETAHALACRMAGVPVRAAGIVWHGGLLPGPYVDTSDASYLPSRWSRFLIPAAGPLVNLLGAGLCAAVLVSLPETASASGWHTGFVLCLAFVCFDLNPFTASDGSHMLEAALDDELARQVALRRRGHTLTQPQTVLRYRWFCALWLVATAAGFVWWW